MPHLPLAMTKEITNLKKTKLVFSQEIGCFKLLKTCLIPNEEISPALIKSPIELIEWEEHSKIYFPAGML